VGGGGRVGLVGGGEGVLVPEGDGWGVMHGYTAGYEGGEGESSLEGEAAGVKWPLGVGTCSICCIFVCLFFFALAPMCHQWCGGTWWGVKLYAMRFRSYMPHARCCCCCRCLHCVQVLPMMVCCRVAMYIHITS
jgi:hypothetical protein